MDTIGTGYGSLIGSRLSPADNKTTEYFNTQTNQGFADAGSLSSFVNSNFNGANTTADNVFSTLSKGYQAPPPVITPESTATATPVNFNQATPTSTPTIPDPYTTPAATLTDTEKTVQQTGEDIKSLNDSMVGKSAYKTAQDETYGVNEASRTVNDLTSQLLGLKAENAAIPLLLESNPSSQGIAQPLINRQQDYLVRQNAIKALTVSAMLSAAQGRLANAQSLSDRAVAAKYDPIQEQITAKTNNLNIILNSPEYSLEEKNRAQKQLDEQNKKQDTLDKQKVEDQNINKIAIDAAANGADAVTLKKISEAKTAVEATQIESQFVEQKSNAATARAANVTTPWVNQGGKFFNAQTGEVAKNEADFFKKAGVTSFADAYAKGLVTDIKATPSLTGLPASYQEYLLAKSDGSFKGSYNDYLDADANRKKSVSVTTGDEEKEITKFNNEATDFRGKLSTNEISWGDAWNTLHAKYPSASNAAIDQALNKTQFYKVTGQ